MVCVDHLDMIVYLNGVAFRKRTADCHTIYEPEEDWGLQPTLSGKAILNEPIMYTVGHKKRATFIFTITLANVNRFQ